MTKPDDEKHVMSVLIQLAEEENRLTETMMDMMGKSNEMASNRTASAELRTVLSEEAYKTCTRSDKIQQEEYRPCRTTNRHGYLQNRLRGKTYGSRPIENRIGPGAHVLGE